MRKQLNHLQNSKKENSYSGSIKLQEYLHELLGVLDQPQSIKIDRYQATNNEFGVYRVICRDIRNTVERNTKSNISLSWIIDVNHRIKDIQLQTLINLIKEFQIKIKQTSTNTEIEQQIEIFEQNINNSFELSTTA